MNTRTTCRKFRQVRQEGSRMVERELPYYNLDMILSLGYRVRSRVGTKRAKALHTMMQHGAIKNDKKGGVPLFVSTPRWGCQLRWIIAGQLPVTCPAVNL